MEFVIVLFFSSLEFTSGSSSGSGSGANLGVNRPPTILGCPPNDTLEESEVEQSPRIIEVSLKTPNLTFTDPDGDNFTVTTNLTSSPSLSNINITNTNETSILVEIHGNELGTMVNRLKLLIKWSVVDTLDEESSCILKYHIQLSTPSICNNTGPTLQLTPQKRDSIELLVSGGSFRVAPVTDNSIQTTIANILNNACSQSCQACQLAKDCDTFLSFCQPYEARNVEILNTHPTIIGAQHQVTVMSYMIVVTNPAQSQVFGNKTIFPPSILSQLLNNAKSEFTRGTGLTILSVMSLNVGSGQSFNSLPLFVLFIALLGLAVALVMGISIVIQITCLLKHRPNKNKVVPMKTEIRQVQPINAEEGDNV